MIVALRADLIIPLDFFAIDDFSAVVTLEPHPFRTLGSLGRFRLGRFLFFKPRHTALLYVARRDSRDLREKRDGSEVSSLQVALFLPVSPSRSRFTKHRLG